MAFRFEGRGGISDVGKSSLGWVVGGESETVSKERFGG